MGIRLVGTGKYLPQKIVSNEDFEKIVDTSDEWIVKRTGIKNRHVSQGEYTFVMGLKAAKKAIKDADISPEDIDLIIFTTISADFYFPSMSNVLQGKLGAKNAYGIDISCACAGFVYALDMAQKYIDSDDGVETVLIVSSENMTKAVDYGDRSTCVLFGDGAGAVVVKKGPNKSYSYLGVDGTKSELIYAHLYPPSNCFTDEEAARKNGEVFPNKKGRYTFMDGPSVYRFAVEAMADSLKKACEKANILPSDLDFIVPHQANVRIINTAVKRLNIPKDKVYINIEKIGNISSACIPLCLAELFHSGVVKENDKIGLVGFGSGFIYGAIVFTV